MVHKRGGLAEGTRASWYERRVPGSNHDTEIGISQYAIRTERPD